VVQRHPYLRPSAAALLVLLFGLAGCSKTSTEVAGHAPDDTAIQLRSVASAYSAAGIKLGRPPKSMEELKPFLKQVGDPDQIMRSTHDGQPFEIVWGVDPDQSGAAPGATLVFAYEKQGSGGKRWVLTQSGPAEMTEEQFNALNVPKPGNKK
jgi:hypothetical protein